MDTLYIYLCKKADCQKWHGKNRVCRYTAVSRKVVIQTGKAYVTLWVMVVFTVA